MGKGWVEGGGNAKQRICDDKWPKAALLTANRRPLWIVTRFGQEFRPDLLRGGHGCVKHCLPWRLSISVGGVTRVVQPPCYPGDLVSFRPAGAHALRVLPEQT